MNTTVILCTWSGYLVLLLFLSHLAKSRDALLPGKVGVLIQSLAYVATYISAVALVGFSGLGHTYGLQIEIIAAGNIWLGVWFVYRYLAWPTKLLQKALNARTPVALLAKGFKSALFGRYLGALSGILILVYCSAVFKGGALMLTSALPLTEAQGLLLLVAVVSISVLWGGLRAVLYTEALQGLIMAMGVIALLVGTLAEVGGITNALESLAKLPPTPQANNGFLAFSSGVPGMNMLFLMLVTSVGVWAQPQVIQRHFALKSRDEAQKIIPLAMLVISLLVAGTYFVGGISRLIVGPDVASPDHVIPQLVRMILPEFGRQLFTLAIVSAALSTASALLHVACASIGQDVFGKKLEGIKWHLAVVCGTLLSGYCALVSSSIIAFICTTSWTIIAVAMWVPYLALVCYGTVLDARCAWVSSLAGLVSALLWYCAGYAATSMKLTGLAAPGFMGAMHPMAIGIFCSAVGLIVGRVLQKRTVAAPMASGQKAASA